MLDEVSPALAKLGTEIVKGLIERVMNFDYLQLCFKKSLRIEPSIQMT